MHLFRIQLGKRRRMLEEAFDERTAEMRLLSECKSAPKLAPKSIGRHTALISSRLAVRHLPSYQRG
jgi:hypothetical protein